MDQAILNASLLATIALLGGGCSGSNRSEANTMPTSNATGSGPTTSAASGSGAGTRGSGSGATTSSGAGGSGPTASAGSANGTSSGTGGAAATTGGAVTTGVAIDPGEPCRLQDAAFCDTFDKPSPGGRGGPLDETLWGFSRYGHLPTQFFVRGPASTDMSYDTPATFCGQPFSNLLPGSDVDFCDGPGTDGQVSMQLNEVFHDLGDFAYNSMMIRQPFDFEGRTGTIVFDVDAKFNPHNLGHGWWMEFWITQDPDPLPYHEAPTVYAYPKNGIGFAFFGFSDCDKERWQNQLEEVTVTRDYEILHSYKDFDHPVGWEDRCFKTSDAQLNRFELRISQDRADLLVSDYDDPTNMRAVASVDHLDLGFTRGYVHLQHSHYNAAKDDATPSQTYRWDNVGFDGPKLPALRAFDVPDNDAAAVDRGAIEVGYELQPQARSITVPGVSLAGATAATFNFAVFAEIGESIEYRFNGNAWHTHTVPSYGAGGVKNSAVRSFSLDVPLSELIEGDNALEVRSMSNNIVEIGAMDLSLEVP